MRRTEVSQWISRQGSHGKAIAIINTSKRTVIAKQATIAAGPWQRMKGLLGRSTLSPGEALVIPQCSSIHTMFMQFPIDVVFIDKQFRVVNAIRRVMPFRLPAPTRGAWAVVELNSGTVEQSATTVGDRLECRTSEAGLLDKATPC